MSPMRRIAEAACRVPEVQDINIVEAPGGLPNISITNQWSEGRDLIPKLSQPIEEILPSTVEQQPSVREDTNKEPEVLVEHIPILNGGGFYMGHTNPSVWIMIFFYTKVTIFENLMKKLDSSWSS